MDLRRKLSVLCALLPLALCLQARAQTVPVNATLETDPALTAGDAVDDPAVWLHPTDPSKNLIIGTDKQSGLFVYGLDGKTVQRLADGNMGNVDVRYGFPLGGMKVALVVANNRTTNGQSVYAVDPATRQLTAVGDGPLATGIVVYGSCLYRSAATGKYYSFVNDKNGVVQQWELAESGVGKVKATMVRSFDVGTQVEGCVADDELGQFYVGEELIGVWKYGAEPSAGMARVQVDSTSAGGHLTADVEGLAIYYAKDRTGYLIASSQGNNSFAIYRRDGANAYVGTFTIADGAIDGVSDCDGVEVLSFPFGPAFPQGIVLAQDGVNTGGNQNFKAVPWQVIANAFTPKLVIDTSQDPRGTDGMVPEPAKDAGTVVPEKDAGTAVTPDAGRIVEDPPTGTPDAGQPKPSYSDAGVVPDRRTDDVAPGCGCGAGASGMSVLAAALLLVRRRRRA
jgi:3-phytase